MDAAVYIRGFTPPRSSFGVLSVLAMVAKSEAGLAHTHFAQGGCDSIATMGCESTTFEVCVGGGEQISSIYISVRRAH